MLDPHEPDVRHSLTLCLVRHVKPSTWRKWAGLPLAVPLNQRQINLVFVARLWPSL